MFGNSRFNPGCYAPWSHDALSSLHDFTPKIISCFREGYSRESFTRDLMAGVVVGIVALPLALAFAIASGVPPERGIYTAIIAGILVSLLGGSRVQIGGPTGAFVVIVYGIVTQFGYGGLVACTFIAGIILIAMGLARFGSLLKFIPYPVITGFTSGIAAIIFSSQIKDLLGLQMGAVPPDFVDKWMSYADVFDSTDPVAVAVSAGTLAILMIWPRVSHRIPAPFVAMVAATAAVQLLDLPVETIGSRFGGIPSTLPAPSLPEMPWSRMRELISPALTIALLAAIESLLSAVVADGLIGGRHRSNVELVAQGAANMGSVLFGGIPATGAIARTATNIKSGGRTPVAGIVHSMTLLAILVLFGRWAAMIPLAALAAILVVVAYNMSEWRSFRNLLSAPRSDIVVLVTTFGLTIFVDLTVAVQVGVVLAALLFMKRMSEVTSVAGVTDQLADANGEVLETMKVPKGVQIYEINGPFFFGAADKLKDVLSEVSGRPRVFILRMRNVPAIDATGMHALEMFTKKCRADGIQLIISELAAQPRHTLVRSPLFALIGRDHIATDLPAAIEKARRFEAEP